MFTGFSRETLTFLSDLKKNNTKEWFLKNKNLYTDTLLLPLTHLVEDLSAFMISLDPLLETNPKTAISRIYRDVRFSHDKSPYRTNMWVAFKRMYKDWKTEPTWFFEIFPDYYRYGMGFYTIPKESATLLRSKIEKSSRDFLMIEQLYRNQSQFELRGETYKRILNPSLSPEMASWYQRKDIYFVCDKKPGKNLFSRGLIKELNTGFTALAPVYEFFLTLRTEK